MEQGFRSLRDLTQHLTTRADDNHAPPVHQSEQSHISAADRCMSGPVKVLRVASNYSACSAASSGPRQVLLVLSLRPYQPGGALNALATARRTWNVPHT